MPKISKNDLKSIESIAKSPGYMRDEANQIILQLLEEYDDLHASHMHLWEMFHSYREKQSTWLYILTCLIALVGLTFAFIL